ncbi:MAG: hypothetical protein JNJ88_13240 [Planctomycetes bacterium]|nr:hypothetical protein [Planctomycetota bacterium]
MSLTRPGRYLLAAFGLLMVYLVGYEGAYRWGASRVWIGPDEMGVVVARVGKDLPSGQILAKPGEKGVREEVLGTGRHFVNPINETIEMYPIIHIRSAQEMTEVKGNKRPMPVPEVGVVTSLVGTPLPEGEFLANEGQRGIWRRVLTPGRYRLNPYAYKVERVPATSIEPGYVGVVTHLSGAASTTELVKPHERGVLETALPPGLYFLNPYEYRVNKVRIGYQELTFEEQNSISFPAADGNTIKVDVTIVWGILPEDAPHIVKQFGSEKAVVDNVIRPQAESKARVAGSNYTSRQFVEGDSRERFQDELTRKLKDELNTKHVRLLLALIRNIDVPDSVRKPIQTAKVAVEQDLTNKAKTDTSKVQTELNTIRGTVEIEAAKARSETEKLVLEETSRGRAEVLRIQAETKKKIAEKQAEAALVRGETKKALGKAEADVVQAIGASEGLATALKVASFGDPSAYGLWRFADALPEGLRIQLRYAGLGTLWTDMAEPAKIQGALLQQMQRDAADEAASRPSAKK